MTGVGDLLASSDVVRLEAGFSSRNRQEHARIMQGLTELLVLLPLTPEVGEVAVQMHTTLLGQGQGRSVGVIDLSHAATAITYGAVVVDYDEDDERLAEVDPRLRQHWVVPQGSVD